MLNYLLIHKRLDWFSHNNGRVKTCLVKNNQNEHTPVSKLLPDSGTEDESV